MKSKILIPTLVILGACSSVTKNNETPRFPASTDNAAAISQALNTKLTNPSRVDEAGNVLIEAADNAKDDRGIGLEDCRKVSLRQAILDASAGGASEIQVSRKASHRVADGSQLRAYVGLKFNLLDRPMERTFVYLLSDPSTGQCSITKREGSVEGLSDRAQMQDHYIARVIPTWTKEQYGKVVEKLKKNHEEVPDIPRAIAMKYINKLISFECEQQSLNAALFLAAQQYRQKFSQSPIIVIDYRNSVAKWSEKEKTPMTGHWDFIMVDSTGKNLFQNKVGFQLQVAEGDQCVGAVDKFATGSGN